MFWNPGEIAQRREVQLRIRRLLAPPPLPPMAPATFPLNSLSMLVGPGEVHAKGHADVLDSLTYDKVHYDKTMCLVCILFFVKIVLTIYHLVI